MKNDTTKSIELLAPARDFEAAQAAILCGADAVYIGAERFGARQAAGNSLDTIRQVVELAHTYYVRVYAAVNTLLTDDELAAAQALAYQLYEIGVDGLIIQDAGLLEVDLPPLPLIASTQMNNASPEKVRFLERIGFSRAILARELSAEKIRAIHEAAPSIELECFVQGALCVGASGQCTMSYALGGRSGNRGECAQPCRRLYTLQDAQGRTIVKDRYLLSLKDMNLSEHLVALLEAGVTSFKIEGRLKDAAYAANVVGFYRRRLDAILAVRGLRKSSSGTSTLHFKPDLQKTFNRGFTAYGLASPAEKLGSIDTPKSLGEPVGVVTRVQADWFEIDGDVELHNGDGICFFDAANHLTGTVVNRVDGGRIYPQKLDDLSVGTEIRRNYDHAFYKQLERPAERNIALRMALRDTADGVALHGIDENGNEAVFEMSADKQAAQKKEQARQTIVTQLSKLGNTPFVCDAVTIETADVYFFPVSTLNAMKRGLAEAMLVVREQNRPKRFGGVKKNETPYPEKHLAFTGNVLNEQAGNFYRRHGVETIEPAAESGLDLRGRTVMTTKYCLRRQLGLCEGQDRDNPAEPLILIDEEGRAFDVIFRCGECGMEIWWGSDGQL